RTHTARSQGTFGITFTGMYGHYMYDLDVKVTSRLYGYDTITVPYGTFDVAKFTMSFAYSGKGDIEGSRSTFSMTESYEIYASPEVGIVKVKEKLSIRLSISGQGSITDSGTDTFELQSLSGLPE
ncbi:MAG: hypothetical protein KAJ95_09650, partial [Gammaproteobacteria bacterium]|nr:hypothetical protein [Gammaproteobacteria bacterium]